MTSSTGQTDQTIQQTFPDTEVMRPGEELSTVNILFGLVPEMIGECRSAATCTGEEYRRVLLMTEFILRDVTTVRNWAAAYARTQGDDPEQIVASAHDPQSWRLFKHLFPVLSHQLRSLRERNGSATETDSDTDW
jgi:hypothetical protein